MYTIRATIAGSFRYYKADRIADIEALQQVFALQGIEHLVL